MALSHPLPEGFAELVAQRFRVLGDPMRIRLLNRLRCGEATVQELTLELGTTQQNVSKHLGVLLQAGMVGRRKSGNFAFYRIVDESVFAICEAVCGSLGRQLDSLGQLVAAGRG
jgi:DNA-binding transcriptional ArsR family regulator